MAGSGRIIGRALAGCLLLVGLALVFQFLSRENETVSSGALGDSTAFVELKDSQKLKPFNKQKHVDQKSTSQWLISGTVTSKETGLPVQEAVIDLFLDPLDQYINPFETVSTNEIGKYQFALEAMDIPKKDFVLGIQADGYAAELERLRPRRKDIRIKPTDVNHDFNLLPGRTITGVVLDQDGVAVEGAEISLADKGELFGGSDGYLLRKKYPFVSSEDNGQFKLVGLPLDEESVLCAQADGFFPYERSLSGDEKEVEVILFQGGARIVGYVYLSDGQPANGVPVRGEQKSGTRQERYDYRSCHRKENCPKYSCTITDENGKYEFSALSAGWQQIIAGYALPYSCIVEEDVYCLSGQTVTCNLKFAEPSVQTVRFFEGASNTPLPGVRVCNMNPNDLPPFMMKKMTAGVGLKYETSTQDGECSILVNRSTELFPITYLYYSPPEPYNNPQEPWIKISVHDHDNIHRISKPVTFSGVIYEPDGETLAVGAEVILSTRIWSGVEKGEYLSRVVTGSNGRYELTKSLPRYRDLYILAIKEPTQAVRKVYSDSYKKKVFEVDSKLVLKNLCSVSGHVRTAAGEPVPDVTVFFSGKSEECESIYKSPKTEMSGFFMADGLHPGTYKVVVRNRESFSLLPEMKIEVTEEETQKDFEVQLAENAVLYGQVVNHQGEPISGGVVAFAKNQGGYCSTETDENGNFILDCLIGSSDVYSLQVSHSNYNSVLVGDLIPEDSPISVLLEPFPQLSFTVINESGEQIRNFYYKLEKQRLNTDIVSKSVDRTIHKQKEPVVEVLTVDSYFLNVYNIDEKGKKGELYGSKAFDVKVGEIIEFEVILKGLTEIRGSVADLEGNPLGGVVLKLREIDMLGNESDHTGKYFESDADGQFVIKAVEVGIYRAELSKKGWVQEGESVYLDIMPDSTLSSFEIVMSQGATVFGKVLGVDGEPIAKGGCMTVGRNVDWDTLGLFFRSRMTMHREACDDFSTACYISKDGTYRLENIPRGTHDICLFASAFSQEILQSESVSLDVGDEVEVNFSLDGLVQLKGKWSINIERPLPAIFLSSMDSVKEYQLGKRYSVYMKPGDYDVLLRSRDGRMTCHSGQSYYLSTESVYQEMDFEFTVQDVFVSIILEDDTTPSVSGTMTWYHESGGGHRTTSTFPISEKRFPVMTQPMGRCRAEFTSEDGTRYISEDWVIINGYTEPHLFLVPEEVAGGE